MATMSGLLRPFVSLFISRPDTPDAAPFAQAAGNQDEQAFLASIAHLPAEEQQKRIQKRLWYAQLAQRQGIMDVEYHASQAHNTDNRLYKFK